MNKIKTYEDFVNEEINLRKAAAGVVLGASLLGGMSSCKKTDIKPISQEIKINDQINTELVKISYYPIKSLYDENGNQSNLPRGCLRDTFDVNIKLKIYKPNDKSDFIEIRDSQNNLIAEGKYEVSEIDNQEIKLPKGSVVLVKYSYVLQLPKQVSNCKYLKRSSVIINGNGGIVTTDEGTNSNSPLIVGDAKIIGDTAWDIDFLSENNITTYVFGKGYVTNKIFGPDFTDATFVNNPVTINGSFGFVLN